MKEVKCRREDEANEIAKWSELQNEKGREQEDKNESCKKERAEGSMQQAAWSMENAKIDRDGGISYVCARAWDMEHGTCNMQHATCSMQHATCQTR